ncbi:MAG: recombinase family protein [Oscillospiraceae bacterium]|nr:recombinase family protein [Oscillospiraceae bacterium]
MARKSRKNFNTAQEPVTPKAVVYAAQGYTRISKDDDKSDSIENQAEIIRDYVQGKPDIDLKNVITSDLGYTGTGFRRPGYTELMSGVLSGNVQCVIVKDLSRLGRSYIEVGELLFDTFPAYNVRFISINDQYDSFADDAGRKKLLILFKNLINHMYSRDLGKKIKSVHDLKKQRGEPAGGKPYGYRRSADGKSLAIDEGAAEIVRLIFNLRQNGVSACGIVKQLNNSGVPSPQKRRYLLGEIKHEKFSGKMLWGPEVVCNILKNEVYTGCLTQGKYACEGKRHKLLPKEQWIRHEDSHPAIISKEQFAVVQTSVNAASDKYRKLGASIPENRYVGKVFCSRCGKTAARSDSGRCGKSLFYYVCRTCLDELKSGLGVKRLPSLPLVRLDAIVTETLRKQIDLLVEYDGLIDRALRSDTLKQKRVVLTHEKAKLEKIAAGTDITISAAYTHHLDGLLDFREYELVRDKAERDKADAGARLAYICEELLKRDIANVNTNTWRESFGAFRDFETPTKELIQTLVSRIILTPGTNEITIELNYMDSFAELRDLITESGVRVSA